MKEREEEMERMREHVFKESDKNRDRMIRYLMSQKIQEIIALLNHPIIAILRIFFFISVLI